MKKKFLSVLLATAMLGTLLTGCGDDGSKNDGKKDTGTTPVASTPRPADSEPSEESNAGAEPVTLRWAIWDQETTAYWKDIKEAYEASHEGVTIEMVD